jgi:5'-3' exonuclease
LPYTDTVLKKADRARTLAQVSGKVISGDKKLPIDSTILFSRILVILQRSPDIEHFFSYELTAVPASLFKDVSLRKANKALLAKEMTKNIRTEISTSNGVIVSVVDGGWLLHRVKWQQNGVYAETLQRYVKYTLEHFGQKAFVVFDGYCTGPTTKDHEHDRRSLKAAPDIVFDESMPVYSNQSAFLANECNKKIFVTFLIHHLQAAGCIVYQAKNDADTLIVNTALQIAKQNQPVTVVANDTDVLVLLVYHFQACMSDICMQSEVTKNGCGQTKLISVREVCAALGEVTTRQILAIHAISGCDTTSSVFGIGKASALKRIARNKESILLTDVVGSCDATANDVAAAGLKLMVLLYGGRSADRLNHMRYVLYMNLTASSTKQLRPERLPPTENAALQHIYRVHLQVVQWKTLMDTDLQPEDWGWRVVDGRYVPVATVLPAAPDDILTVIRCKCKMETKRPCSTQLCSCLKHGLACVSACKNCHGDQCDNADVHSAVSEDDDDEEMVVSDIEDLFPDDCKQFDVPWLYEEVVAS